MICASQTAFFVNNASFIVQ